MSSNPVDFTNLIQEPETPAVDFGKLSQYDRPELPPEGKLTLGQQWAKKLIEIRDKLHAGMEDVPPAEKRSRMIGGVMDAMGVPFTPVQNVAEEAVLRTNPKETLGPINLKRLLTPEESEQPLAGHPVAKGVVDFAAAAIPLTPPVVKGAKALNKLRQSYVAAQEEKALAKASSNIAPYLAKGTSLEIPEKAGEAVSGAGAVTKAQAELGPVASTIPDQLFRPTGPQVKAGREMGTQANLIPDLALAETPKPMVEGARLKGVIEDHVASVKALKKQLSSLDPADFKTREKLKAALAEERRTLADLRSQVGRPEKITGPKDFVEARTPPPPEPVKEKLAEEAKSSMRTMINQLRETNHVLKMNGQTEIPDMAREATRLGDKLENKFMSQFANIYKKFSLNVRGRDEMVARALNGEDMGEEINAIAKMIRRDVLDPAWSEVATDPNVRQLIGPVGYLKDYFPHLRDRLMARYNDPALVQGFVHDLMPPNLKASFFKTRELESTDFNKDLKEVVEAYIRGVRKTKYDLPVYDKGMTIAQKIPDAEIKTLANDFLRNYIGQPSSMMGDRYHNAAQWAARQMYRSYIGFNPYSIATNLTQSWFNTMPKAGIIPTGKAFVDMIRNPKATRAAAQEAGVLEGYPQLEELVLSMGKDFGKTFMNKLDDKLFWGFKKSEEFNRILANQAGKRRAMAKGVTDPEELEKAGYNMAADTQFLYGRKAPVPFARDNPLLGQFSNYPLKQIGFIQENLKNPRTAARMVLAYGLPAVVTTIMAGGETPEEKAKNAASAAVTFFRDVMPIPTLAGPVVSEGLRAQEWFRGVAEGRIKATPSEVMEKVVRFMPAYRSAQRFYKKNLVPEGEKSKPFFGLAEGGEQ